MNRLPAAPDPVAAALKLLHRAGWSVGDYRGRTEAGLVRWFVDGRNGENLLRAQGATAAEAWTNAVSQARGLGMLGRGGGPPS